MNVANRKASIVALFSELARKGTYGGRAKYYNRCLNSLVRRLMPSPGRLLELGCGTGDLLAATAASAKVGIDLSPDVVEFCRKRHPELDVRCADAETVDLDQTFDTVCMVNLASLLDDIHATLQQSRKLLAEDGNLLLVHYNHLWEPILRLASKLGLRLPIPEENWLPLAEITNLLHLTGYDVVRSGRRMLIPVNIPIVSSLVNRLIAPLPFLNNLALIEYVVARPVVDAAQQHAPRSCSVIIPTKDERGNIQAAIERTPEMGPDMEIIFVDGNSTDGTVEEIRRIIAENPGRNIRFISQGEGRGKADAVRKGFALAGNDILMILDSDLTMPPEDLPKYYDAIVTGRAQFVNGCRLVYPMEKQAMRFLNKIANHIFGWAFSWLLEQRLRDTLCGTKVLTRANYLKIAAARSYFGDFDPFGDFDLLFGAARLNLKIVDMPIRYRERTYGDIKIHRWKHGVLLLRMVVFAARKLKFA